MTDKEPTVELREVNAKFPTEGGWQLDAKFAGSAPVFVAKEFVRFFKESGGVNYVEMKMLDPDDTQMYVVTVQRCNGKTPHELLLEAKAASVAPSREQIEALETYEPYGSEGRTWIDRAEVLALYPPTTTETER